MDEMAAYLPAFLLHDLPDYDLQEIAYILDLPSCENWALRQRLSLPELRGPDVAYYAARGRLGAGVGVQRGIHLSATDVHRLLPDGLGRTGHMRAAAVVPHLFPDL
jgi:hypothetical protein